MFARFVSEGGTRDDSKKVLNDELSASRWWVKNSGNDSKKVDAIARRKAAHRVAISLGFKYNRATHQYE